MAYKREDGVEEYDGVEGYPESYGCSVEDGLEFKHAAQHINANARGNEMYAQHRENSRNSECTRFLGPHAVDCEN